MKNTKENYQQLRQKVELQISNAISLNGGIELITPDGDIVTDMLIANTKGLYAVDDFELIKIEAILQSLENGSVMVHTKDYGLMKFDFEFVGDREKCYKFILDKKEANAKTVAGLNHSATL